MASPPSRAFKGRERVQDSNLLTFRRSGSSFTRAVYPARAFSLSLPGQEGEKGFAPVLVPPPRVSSPAPGRLPRPAPSSPKSGRRDSNPRPPAPKAGALSN